MGGSSNGSGMSTKDSAGFGNEGHNGFQFTGMSWVGSALDLGSRVREFEPRIPDHLIGFASPVLTRMKLV